MNEDYMISIYVILFLVIISLAVFWVLKYDLGRDYRYIRKMTYFNFILEFSAFSISDKMSEDQLIIKEETDLEVLREKEVFLREEKQFSDLEEDNKVLKTKK